MCLRYVDAGRREYKQENTGHICQGNTLAWLTGCAGTWSQQAFLVLCFEVHTDTDERQLSVDGWK